MKVTKMTIEGGHEHERQALLCHADVENPTALQQALVPVSTVETEVLHLHEHEEEDNEDDSASTSTVQKIKYLFSTIFVSSCVYLLIAGIFANETPVSQACNPLIAFITMWLLILWLGILEGGQGCLVGLQPIDKEAYSKTHPIALKCTILAHEGDNLNRFIIGRQFLVVLVVFLLNQCCTTVEHALIPHVPPVITEIFVGSGLAVMLVTAIVAQLSAEVSASHSMLDFINTPVVFVMTWFCLAIESSGLLHSVYLVQHFFELFTESEATKKGYPSETPVQSLKERAFYWGRVLFSFAILSYAMVATLVALLHDQTTFFEGLPDLVNVVIFFGLVCFLGMMEAMQIALFAVVNLDESELADHPVAQANSKLAFSGKNFQAFLIGRQICVTFSMFLLARIMTTDVDLGPPPPPPHHLDGLPPPPPIDLTVLHMGPGMQEFFNTGLPGALITTIVASLAWRIFAASFPIAFMSNPCVYWVIRLNIMLESSGAFSAAWLLAKGVEKVVGFQSDEVYLGAMGQRASGVVDDTKSTFTNSTGDDSDSDTSDIERSTRSQSFTSTVSFEGGVAPCSSNYGSTTSTSPR